MNKIRKSKWAWLLGLGLIASLLVFNCDAPGAGPEDPDTLEVSLAEGTYYAMQDIEITVPEAGATVRYTTNGTEPTEVSGELYTGPITIAYTCEFTAVAFKDGAEIARCHNNYTLPLVVSAGSYSNGVRFNPCFWLEGIRYDLPVADGYEANAFRSVPYAGKIYTVGSLSSIDGEYTTHACYWINQTLVDLDDEGGISNAYGIAIDKTDGTVYTAGIYQTGTGEDEYRTACYWRNTERIDLPSGTEGYAAAAGICLYNGTVYTSGLYQIAEDIVLPCFWIGTTRQDLPGYAYYPVYPDPEPALWFPPGNAWSITVADDTVYCGGSVKNIATGLMGACYWEQTLRHDLDSESFENSMGYQIYVNGSDVYLAGGYSDGEYGYSCYWKNGSLVTLPGQNPGAVMATDLCVSKGKVYTAGAYHDGSKLVPCYWIDSIRHDLYGDGVHSAWVYSIYLEE
ncbi:MAG: chitobiase/beta-hexosaminidase C-terminal domain-containing protein [Spirochaetales bacterium]|nr:chitobiase/beta-hexosaminidase C-terminal domain-containing protein [Spirochaetales bacterium]